MAPVCGKTIFPFHARMQHPRLLQVQLLSKNTLVLFEGLEEPSSRHRGDGRGFEDPLHGYQWLQDVLKSANAAKALLMGARKEPGEAVS